MQATEPIPVHALAPPRPARRAQAESPVRTPPASSAIYVGWVRHRRFAPINRAFTFPIYMLWIDLDEIDLALATGRLWATDHRRRTIPLARFRRSDYLGDPSRDLKQQVLERVEQSLGFRPDGPVRLLTHARQYGYVFNPVSFYYCFARDPATQTETLSAIIAEITNTPWKERHAYVLDCRQPVPSDARPRRFTFNKAFHVSPFMPMGLTYDWSFSVPCPCEGSRLGVHMTLREPPDDPVSSPSRNPGPVGRRIFDATLRLSRRELRPHTLDTMLLRYPFMTARVILSIHWHALVLWLRRVPVVAHPTRSNDKRP